MKGSGDCALPEQASVSEVKGVYKKLDNKGLMPSWMKSDVLRIHLDRALVIPGKTLGMGLLNMRERAETVGGIVLIGIGLRILLSHVW